MKTVVATRGVSAAMAGRVSALITVPSDTIKTQLQVLNGQGNGMRGPTVGQILRNLVREGRRMDSLLQRRPRAEVGFHVNVCYDDDHHRQTPQTTKNQDSLS